MDTSIIIVLVIVGIWLIAITSILIYTTNKILKLSKDVNKGNLVKILEKVLSTEKKNTADIKWLKKEIEKIDLDAEVYIQKIGLVRFNPFKELGGDHSFSLTLLDREDTGIILTGLHTRERTRVYIKEITKGESKVTLSIDEKKSLRRAKLKKGIQ